LDRRRAVLEKLYRAALAGVDPAAAVARAFEDPGLARKASDARHVGVFSCGKAAAAMARGVPAPFLASGRGLVIVPRGAPAPAAGLPAGIDFELLEASHPEPDPSSVAAARAAVRFFESFGPGDLILCLVSGGTSSLLCLPRPGLTLAAKRRRIREAASQGAAIAELNRIRTSLSAVKGGRLGRRTRAVLATLVLSDVPGDDPATVGSGPTIRGRRGDYVAVVGSNRSGLEAARRKALELGWEVTVRRRRLSGEASVEGERIGRAASRIAPGSVLLAGGETTVRLPPRPGKGGRALELALGAADALDGQAVTLLSAGSDGRDGSSDAAGGWADGTTLRRARRLGLAPEDALSRHDSDPFFSALGDRFVAGPTGTNVADWVFALRPRESPSD
jgi:hydroxypyruvate reductase